MSENTEKKKYKSYRFQRFIAIGYVMNEPELKVMKPFRDGEDGLPYCNFMASTGSPFGSSDDAVFSVMLKGKNAEMFCSEPRKGKEYLFDLQLRTYNKEPKPGERYGERITSFVGNFNFCGPREKASGEQEAPPPPKPEAGVTEKKQDDIPFN